VKDKKIQLMIFLKKSELRNQIWSILKDPKTATDISKELKKHRSAISRILIEMEKEGFIKCLNPEDDKFRHYLKK